MTRANLGVLISSCLNNKMQTEFAELPVYHVKDFGQLKEAIFRNFNSFLNTFKENSEVKEKVTKTHTKSSVKNKTICTLNGQSRKEYSVI
jgi:hypothetical protein